MTKAQEVRCNRLYAKEAKNFFDFILNLFELDTIKGYFGPINLCYNSTKNSIERFKDFDGGTREYFGQHYVLPYDFSENGYIILFKTTKTIIDKEDGYYANLNEDVTLGMLTLEVGIE